MKRPISISFRLAAAMTAGAIAGCGGGGESKPPTAGGNSVPTAVPAPVAAPAPGSAIATAPATATAPNPAADVAPGPAPAPAPAYAPDRLKGETIFQRTGGSTGVPCMSCHGTIPTARTASEALEFGLISNAVWSANSAGNASMSFYQGELTGFDMLDVAAYIHNPAP